MAQQVAAVEDNGRIEKKPLNHFLPGTPVLSFGTAGCNMACKFCQNWVISKSREFDRLQDRAPDDDIRQRGRADRGGAGLNAKRTAVNTADATVERQGGITDVLNQYSLLTTPSVDLMCIARNKSVIQVSALPVSSLNPPPRHWR